MYCNLTKWHGQILVIMLSGKLQKSVYSMYYFYKIKNQAKNYLVYYLGMYML